LDVFLLEGPVTEAFTQKNPVVSRTIQVRGEQTLADLHQAIFAAFDRWEQHLYEFQFGEEPMDPEATRYTLPGAFGATGDGVKPPAGLVTETTLGSLGLKVGDRFAYWFDFGDDWWHQINVEDIQDQVPKGKFPKVTKRVGQSPPQYPPEDEDEGEEESPQELDGANAADAACLVGEHHLAKGDYDKAVEAFTRALENNPTADAFEGRARAYRALALQDERKAEEMR
jgi:tetratricopeptide (TPR) repeat protein